MIAETLTELSRKVSETTGFETWHVVSLLFEFNEDVNSKLWSVHGIMNTLGLCKPVNFARDQMRS